MDIAENSVRAGATRIVIKVEADTEADTLKVSINDNGSGMSAEQLSQVTDPFFTTRTTRNVGLGVPFFKMAAELAGGGLTIDSKEGEGTSLTAVFGLSHVDRMPLGDMTETIHTLVTMHEDIDFLYLFRIDSDEFSLNTKDIRDALDGVSFNESEVTEYIWRYLDVKETAVLRGRSI